MNNPKTEAPLEVKHGLPAEVKFCKGCVMSNQRPVSVVEYTHVSGSKKKTVNFEDGICDGCRFAEKKRKTIDWEARDAELRALCDKYRKNDGSYDCLVPGSGGKDSFYAAHMLKYKYGMHPLTITWAPHIYTEWGWKNQQAWIHAGFDNILWTPNGRVHRLLTRLATENMFHPFQPFIIGQKVLAAKLAVLHNLPLVFYGEHEAEYGNPIGEAASAKRDSSYHTGSDKSKMNLGGVSLGELVSKYGLEENDLDAYLPAKTEDVQKVGVQIHYLGYYLKWHPQSCYYYAVEHGGFQVAPERTPGTYSKYNSLDDCFDDFFYYTTFVKFGIGRATYDAAQEIYSGDIRREEGVALVHRFDGEWPERFAQQVFDYLSIPAKEYPVAHKMFEKPMMTRESFDELADKFRSPHLWEKRDGQWKLRHQVA